MLDPFLREVSHVDGALLVIGKFDRSERDSASRIARQGLSTPLNEASVNCVKATPK
jgi:hypothetical protein